MKKIILLFILLNSLTPVSSQESPVSAIRGIILDKQSQYPIVGATVIVTDTDPTLGATTDLDGRFRIEGVPVGRHTVIIQYTGYEPQTLSGLLVVSGKDLEIICELLEYTTQMNTIEIIASDDKAESINKMSSVSSRSFSLEEARRYAGSLQDPARMAQNYAGVSNASDDRNDIIIRGNSPTGVLWRMEGIDIPNPSHFSTLGTTGGPVSILNANNLANSDFATSAFAAEYGNALAGVFDLRMRTGNRDKREFMGQIGFNGFEFGAEGPFKKGKSATYVLNYRYSVLGLVQALGVNFGTGAAVPQYQDITFKTDFPTKKAGRFSLFGFGGTSFIDFKAEDSGENNLYSDNSQNSQFQSRTGVAGVSHTYFFNETSYGKLVIAASRSQNGGYIDSLNVSRIATRTFGTDRTQDKVSGHYLYNRKFDSRSTLRTGLIVERYFFQMIDSALYNSSEYFRESDFSGHADLAQAYAQWNFRATDKWTLNTGVHAQHFFYNQTTAIEPRIGARYAITPMNSVNFGAGLHSQLQPITVYFNRERMTDGTAISNNRNLDFNKAAHLVIGFDHRFNSHSRLKTEAYYQHLYNIAVDRNSSSFSMLNVGADFGIPNNGDLVNSGTGFNYGVEITLERFLHKGFYYLLTTSLFQSKYVGSDGVERNTAFNGNYVSNILAGKEWKSGKNNAITADIRFTYAGGRRHTPVDLNKSREVGSEVRDESQSFGSQYSAYFRTDVKVGYRFNGAKISQVISLDIRNVTNNQNVFATGYDRFSRNIETTYQTGLFPMVLYNIYF
jgi:hypothetical protein